MRDVVDHGQAVKNVDKIRIGAEAAFAQHGALCFRETGGRTEILLVTSRDTGRWVLPKGWPMRGRTGAQSALREAFEEAGVEGKLVGEPVGIYSYRKVLGAGSDCLCAVTVHPVRVSTLTDRFPERRERERRWFGIADAAKMVTEPELRDILEGFVPPEAA